MAPSLVQNASATATGTGPVTVTLGAATAAHNCLVVVVGTFEATTNPVVSGITLGGLPDHFSQAKQANTNADANCEIWTDQNCAGGQTSVVVSFSGGSGGTTGVAVRVMEWSGVSASLAVDATSSAAASSSSYSSGSSGTLAQASEVVIGAVYAQTSAIGSPTVPGAPWTEFALLSPVSGQDLGVGYQVVSATTAQTYSGNITGAGPTSAAVIVTLTAAVPASSGLRVTAAGGGAAGNGMLLRVRVLDNAILAATPNTVTNSAKDISGATAAITPAMSGSLIYSVCSIVNGLAPGGASGNTTIDSEVDSHNVAHGTFVTGTTTMNTPLFVGSNGLGGGAQSTIAAVEVQPYGGAVTTDASSPAALARDNSFTLTTAAFQPPPGGKLILALVSDGQAASGGTTTMAVSDSFGLTWAKAAEAPTTANPYSAIWYAYSPAALALASATPTPGMTGTAYSYTLTATGGYGSYTWAVASGSLPAGLSLSSSGVISGTPTTAGLATFTVTATDLYGFTVTSATLSLVVNAPIAGTGSVRAGWTAAAPAYFYGTLEIPVSTTEHDWVFVAVSWLDGEDQGIAYCADSAHNLYQVAAFSSGVVNTQVFAVPNARAASTVYVSTSAYARYLTACVLDVSGLQPGFTVDLSTPYSGGPSTAFTASGSTAQPDFILAVGAFSGTPQAITQTGSGVTWTSLSAGINGTGTAGITQAAAVALTSGAASPSRTFTAASSGNYAGALVAVYAHGGLPANPNPAWPVIGCQAAFGYTPQEPTVPPTWTDITPRFLGLNGQHGRSFELDQLNAADISITLDNHDGALSPGGALGADLITPIRVTATWQGRTYAIFHGVMVALPQTYDFQYGIIKLNATDDYSKLATTLLPTCMIQEMLYDKPVSLWPLNEQQQNGQAAPPPGQPVTITTLANNWSGRSVATLTPTNAAQGGGSVPVTVPTVVIFGMPFAIYPHAPGTQAQQPQPPNTPTTGFGNQNTGTYPLALMGTADSVWGNTATQVILNTSSTYQGTVLVDANDSTLPLTSTGATYSVWAQMFNVAANTVTGAVVFSLTDAAGPAGGKNYLTVFYDGTHAVVSQTAGSHSFTPSVPLFDGHWHLWTVTVTTGGVVTLKLDGANLGSFTGSFPAGSPSMLQLGGDTTAVTAGAAGIFTGCMSLAGAYDRVVDDERIASWFQSGATGFLDELAGARIQRILAWARWNAPQAVDPGLSLQQPFNYLTGGYGGSGLSGSIGNQNTAGGSAAITSGAQADITAQDVANTDNGFLFMGTDGLAGFRQRDRISNFPAGLSFGDTDIPLNTWELFENSLGPWTSTVSCTVARSAGWSYAGAHSALVTVTGTPVTAYAWGDSGPVQPGQVTGFSCWVMSPQGCSVQAAIDFWGAAASSDNYDSLYDSLYGSGAGFGLISTVSSGTVFCPPMTPVFLNLTGATAPAGATTAYPHPVIVSSPATGTQLYFDRPRLSPPGFLVPYEPDVEITKDIQFLFNDVAITRNVDQATYRARDAGSRAKYYPRVYTRTVYSSVNDATAVQNCATFLVTNFASPAIRVTRVTVDAAADPELWPFVLSAGIGDSVSFTRTPPGGAVVTGSFTILSVEPDIGPDKAQFTYVLAPGGVF